MYVCIYEWTCPACGELGKDFYSDENAISPYGDIWACGFVIKPKPTNTMNRYMFKDQQNIRTIPEIPNIPHIDPIEYEKDTNTIPEANDSPRPHTSSNYAASEAPSHRTELGSDDGTAHPFPDNPAD